MALVDSRQLLVTCSTALPADATTVFVIVEVPAEHSRRTKRAMAACSWIACGPYLFPATTTTPDTRLRSRRRGG